VADVFTKSKRSEVMSAIRSAGNRETELVMVALLRELDITGWRRGQKLRFLVRGSSCIVRPDILFRRERIAVFLDGEFWHGHPRLCRIPATRREWWKAKIETNKRRDRRQNRLLRRNGWTVVRIWQHELTPKHRAKALRKLRYTGLMGG
jgi:DNA mismatch endonuclease, patch repair protein